MSALLEEVEAEFQAAFDVSLPNVSDSLEGQLTAGAEIDAIVFSLDVQMDSGRIASLPESVRAIATYSVGTDHIDLEAARARGLAVFNTPGVLADSVAENAIFLMLGAARRGTESINLIRERSWTGWSPRQLVGVQLSGRKLGILGMGDIGLRVAARAEALGMEILYSNRRPPLAGQPWAAGYRETAIDLVRESDVLLLACPSTHETRGIVDAALLAEAKSEMILVNIARGDLVVDEDLISALAGRKIWAAALDVFAGEPNLDSRYFELPNVFMVPHIGSSTIEARLGMGRILIDALLGWRRGETVPNQV